MPDDESKWPRPPDPATDDTLAQDVQQWAGNKVDAVIDALANESQTMQRDEVLPQHERRRHPRYSLEEPAKVEIGSWAELLELYTKDISRNGIFIQTDSPAQMGSQVGVHLLLPDGAGTIRFQGEVVHVVPPQAGPMPGFGVRFYDMSQEAQNTLMWLIAQAEAAIAAPRGGEAARVRNQSVAAAERRRTKAEAEQAERSRLRTVLAEMGAQPDLQVLGLYGQPTLEEIDRAFVNVREQWDPRKLDRQMSPQVEQLYRSITFRIERAYHRLRASQTSATAALADALSKVTLGDLE